MVAHPSIPSSRGSPAPSPLTAAPNLPPGPILNLTDDAAARIIRELAEASASLDSVAAANGLAVADLALWLTTPAARERMLVIEHGGYAHVRMAASLKLSSAVAALLRVLDTFNALAASRTADDPLVIRAAIHANKAAYHLYRLSRILPIDETQRARANEGIRAARTIATQVSHAIASPPQPHAHTQAAPAPAAQPLAANVGAPVPPPPIHPPAPHLSAPDNGPSDVAGGIANEAPADIGLRPVPQSNPQPNPQSNPQPNPQTGLSMDQILTQLTALATSLGIDISDLDDPGPDLLPSAFPCATEPLALADTT